MSSAELTRAVATVPAGAWAVGVSGGADSVSLLMLLRARPDLSLHLVHLDHQTRGRESTTDAEFVIALAARLGLACTIALRSDVEMALADLPANPSSRYRAARLALFRRVAREHSMSGVILAHHGGDHAETILLRLLRGSGPMGLAAMEPDTHIAGLRILRPLLGVRGDLLRDFLRQVGQPWREDASNASNAYLRNRVRRALAREPRVGDALRALGTSCGALRDWVRSSAPELEETFAACRLAELPPLLATESARRWLAARGTPPDRMSPAVIERLLRMAADAASSPRSQFPNGVTVYRRAGMISAGGV